jgi:hypothetical protein
MLPVFGPGAPNQFLIRVTSDQLRGRVRSSLPDRPCSVFAPIFMALFRSPSRVGRPACCVSHVGILPALIEAFHFFITREIKPTDGNRFPLPQTGRGKKIQCRQCDYSFLGERIQPLAAGSIHSYSRIACSYGRSQRLLLFRSRRLQRWICVGQSRSEDTAFETQQASEPA